MKYQDVLYIDIQFTFSMGDKVLVHAKRSSKLDPRVKGLYTLMKYLGIGLLTAQIKGTDG